LKKFIVAFLTVLQIVYADWEPLSQNTFERARAERKIIAVYLHKPNCPYCAQFQYQTLQNQMVKAALKKFVTASVNVAAVKSPYSYRLTPTVVFVDSNNNIVADSTEGPVSAIDFESYLSALAQAAYGR
jgi:hypothetical protein